jgi:hypothetical protein
MSYRIKTSLGLLTALLLLIVGCKKEDKTFGDLTPPGAPDINVNIIGKNAVDTAGDGSGKIIVTLQATNAINYKVDFGDGSVSNVSTNNVIEHTYSFIGVRNFTITAIATGKAGLSSTSSTVITIKKNYTPPADLVTQLTNNASKTWKVDSVAYGHFGVGPAGSYYSDWWNANPNDKAGLGIYDDEYTFNSNGNVFTHTTNSSIFGKKEFLTDFDPTLTGSGDYTLYGPTAANYSESFSYDGDPNAEYIVFSAKGHMGLYLGSHRYQVLQRTATNMWFRYLGRDGNAWYVRIKAI